MAKLLKDKKNILLIFWILALLVYYISVKNTWIAEHIFARGIFALYSNTLSLITGVLPVSLGEFIIILLPLFIIICLVIFITRIIKHSNRVVYLVTGVRNVLITVGIIFFWFMIGCGTNYYRYEFTSFCGLEVKESSANELYELCLDLTERTNEARIKTGTPDDTVFTSLLSNYERATLATEAMDKLSDTYEILGGHFPKPKPVINSHFMSKLNITGVYFPFTAEANVNINIPDYSHGSVLCHELVHVRGFMREDEANYIAYLACCASASAEFNYSGLILALIISSNRLYEENPELYYSVSALYSEGVRRDMNAGFDYWEEFEDTTLSEIGETVNDSYLKANNQTDGTKSYGRMVDLLLAELRKKR